MRLKTKIFLLAVITTSVLILPGCHDKTESIPDPTVANVFLKMQVKSDLASLKGSGRVMDSTLLMNELVMGVREIRFVEMGTGTGNTGTGTDTNTGDGDTGTGNYGGTDGTGTGSSSDNSGTGSETDTNTGNDASGSTGNDSGSGTSTGGSSDNTGNGSYDSSHDEENDSDNDDSDGEDKDSDDGERDDDDDDDELDRDDDDDRIADSMGGASLNGEIVFSGGFAVDFIRGTSTPDFGAMEVIPGTYQRIVIESGPYLEDGNTLFIAMEYYENGNGPLKIEFTSQSSITIDVENPEGIQLDGGSFIQILILLNIDKLFAGVDFSMAEPDTDGVVRINRNSNADLAMIIESQIGPAFEAGTDINGDGVIDSSGGV